MSARVCAILRKDRGRLTSGVRLVGLRTDESWEAAQSPPGTMLSPSSSVLVAEQDAASWVARRLGDNSHLAAVCIDVDGALCAWMSVPSREARLVASLARSGPAQAEGDAAFTAGSRGSSSTLTAYAGSELDSSVHVLGGAGVAIVDVPDVSKSVNSKSKSKSEVGARPSRIPVLAISDVPARLFVDSLDAQGVTVDAVLTLWHAAALAWDPSAKADASQADLANAVTTAIVLVDAAAGRLLWCWSVGGTLLSGSSMRLARPREGDGVSLGEAEAARLATEWLAWSVQLGRTPARVIAVSPSLADDELAAFGRALGTALHGCVVDVAVHDDPIGVTLARLAEKLDDAPALPPSSGLASLATRPGAAHRRMHHWLSLAIIGLAAMLGAVAWRLGSNVGAADVEAAKQADRWREILKEVYPEALSAPEGATYDKLKTQYAKREKELRPPEAKENARPVLAELDALSFVLSNPDYDLTSLQIPSGGQVVIDVKVKTIEQGEELFRSLSAVSGSAIARWSESYTNEGSGETARVRCRFSGTWTALPPKAASPATAEAKS